MSDEDGIFSSVLTVFERFEQKSWLHLVQCWKFEHTCVIL